METTALRDLIDEAKHIVVIQADNPDGDSLASALALEHILGDLGKDITMYCGVEVPSYLRYLSGWDRVVHELPRSFDASLIIDTSAVTLLETLDKSGELSWLKAKPCALIDHHTTPPTIDFANASYIQLATSTGELIYSLSKEAGWKINPTASDMLATSILADTLGLMSESVTPKAVRVVADLIESGVSLAKLDESRRSLQKKSPAILKYKGELLTRVGYSDDHRIAYIDIPWKEIEKYSHEYNPPMLVLDEMRMVQGVCVTVAFKSYPDGKITGKIRTNHEGRIADKLAEHFGGGGHPYAAGFKIKSGKSLEDVKAEFIKTALELLG